MQRAAVSLVLALLLDGGTGIARPKPVLAALLSVAHGARAEPADDAWSATEIDRVARAVRARLRDNPRLSPIDALNETVFGTLKFVREVDDTDPRFVLLPSVLKNRRGSCVGLGTLYLALGEALGWPAAGVMVPGHFFVRMDEHGRTRNVELLRRGEEMPDSWYEGRFPLPSPGVPEYSRALALREVLGVIEYDVGNDLRRKGRLFEARRSYESATRDFPALSEAHASLGTTLHLLGALDEAERSYQAAKRANPGLAGVDANLDLLRQERTGETE
jgi:regulator of sirC expression with transglutaminase-like and TPR domain